MDISGSVAIVTGGSRGIGRAICRALADAGATVIVADVEAQEAERTVEAIRAGGGEAQYIETDVSREASVKALYARALAGHSKVDILVNNAGICRMIPIVDIEVEEWDRVMAVNLRGTFLMCREALRIMKGQGAGKIVSLGSAAAKTGGAAAGAHYSASKAGVICLTKSLAHQAASYKINVNAVCPGPIKTEMTDAWGDQANQALAQKIPWQQYGQPEDVANAVCFLVSPQASYITGEILDVNGGLVMD